MKNIDLETLKILENRRSCRSYTNEQITGEELTNIIRAGQTAPIGMNRINDIKIIVIQDKNVLEKLEKNTWTVFSDNNHSRSAIYNAPTLIIIAVKKSEGIYEKGQYCSAACILENMIFTATEMELGTVYLSGVTSALNKNSKLLNEISIPDDYEAASALAIGKMSKTLKKRDLNEQRIAVEWL